MTTLVGMTTRLMMVTVTMTSYGFILMAQMLVTNRKFNNLGNYPC